jgi:ribonuclease G
MSKEIYISSTPHETRLAIVENDALAEMYYERENEYTLAGSIYNGKVTRVLPGMQSSFVDIGLDRDAFLYITDFMEEAGDTADFEANANGGDHRRAPRTDRGSDRGDRGPRPERTLAPPAEPTDSELFTQAVEGIEPQRNGGDRDRNRRGGRNRRDRGQDRGSRQPLPPRTNAPLAPILESHPDTPAAELGEGAPGADGSRRWRGRRGRRGSRDGARETTPQVVVETLREATGPVENAYAEESPYEFDTPTPEATESGETQSDRAPRRDRNDRGDRGGRRERAPRAPRGFAPSTNLYQVEGSADTYGSEEEIAAPAEPIILPGESLRKYRPADETSASPATEIPVAAPAQPFVVSGWDGGAVLPGETIRPRTPSASSESSASHRSRDDRGNRDNRGGRDDRGRGRNDRGGRDRNRDDRPRREDRTPRPEQFAAPVATPEPVEHAEPFEAAAPLDAAPTIHTTFVPPPPMPVQEYEPSEASASYRVDPVPPSQFIQPAAEVGVIEEEAFEEHIEEEHIESAPEPHDITSISAAGDMHSEAPALTTQELTAPSEAAAELSAEIAAAEPEFEHTPASESGAFAPGAGILEEEELFDEDEELSLHAHSHEDVLEQHHEQETLENAADLGSMIREMSIDQITRAEAGPDEDDDFEEDFLEEDQDYAESDSEEDDSEEAPSEEDESDESFLGDDVPADAAGEFTSSEPRAADAPREPRRDRGRRDGRRGDRNRRGGGDRDRSSDRGSDRGPDRSGGNAASDRSPSSDRGRRDGGRGRQSMQSTNLPAISDLLKPGQEILVQIAKEPIAKKGARITSHIALPGRFLVFMPTVSHTGVSRKIESDHERRRLKEILLSEKGDASGGFIVRTAAAGASEEELRSDLRFLLNLWADIKARSEASKSPALIYHDLNLIERVLRDQVTDTFSAIWVDTETEYERVLRFLQRFQPSLIRRVKLYTKETPLFEQFGITEEINKALRSKVWLKSGGSIVINQTEALVAIDINTGKFVGKTARLEDTIVKTNLDAIPEIVRQIRLRDLGGIIIIDFIDMDERKNRNKVMAALEEELKSDRAPSKVLQFNDFGLVAITRKRVKQSLERTLSTTCGVCAGTGMVKSPITVCNDIYIEMRKMHKHLERGDVMLRVHPEVVKQLKSTSSRWLQEMEEMVGKTILVKSDPSLHPEQFDIH